MDGVHYSVDNRDTVGIDAHLDSLAWPDLVLAAKCVLKDGKANEAMMQITMEQVVPKVAAQWRRHAAEEGCLEVLSTLHTLDEAGLNRGRAKLLCYGGRSSLAAWLVVVAGNRLISERERLDRAVSLDVDGDGKLEVPQPQPSDVAEGDDLVAIRECIARVFAETVKDVASNSPAQLQFAYLRCVHGLGYAQIAERLQVGRGRVTELSQAFCTKILNKLEQLAPSLDVARGSLNPETRVGLEEGLRDWFADHGAPEGLSDALDRVERTLSLRADAAEATL